MTGMGHIIMPASSFVRSLSEDAGERSGFALTREQVIDHLPSTSPLKAAAEQENRPVRMASELYADTVGDMLYALGAAEQPGMPTITERLVTRLGNDWQSQIGLMEMMEVEAVAVEHLRRRIETGQFDRAAFNADLDHSVGASKVRHIMDHLLEILPVYLAQSPYFTRDVSAADEIELNALFQSESLPFDGATFFDQRFVNYLSAQPELLSEINWRQFEGLAAEWLRREGYEVELGPGRDDGGIDIRAWTDRGDPSTPPAIIVQCKREARKVGKTVVKALWSDVFDEGAKSGLIVTSSDISPGAAKVIEARAYPITTANRAEVQRWIKEMRKPEAGVIL